VDYQNKALPLTVTKLKIYSTAIQRNVGNISTHSVLIFLN